MSNPYILVFVEDGHVAYNFRYGEPLSGPDLSRAKVLPDDGLGQTRSARCVWHRIYLNGRAIESAYHAWAECIRDAAKLKEELSA